MTDKLSIKNEMAMFDGKVREFYDELTDDERKKFGPFLMIRWGSSVSGDADLQEWYLRATNERLNINFFDLGKHPKLQWLLATTVSPGMGNQYHEWISPKKRGSSNNKTIKFLKTQYPELDDDDLELLAEINSTDDIKQLARDLGWNAKQIKSDL
tara:strand:+ start:45 stop:509 length:465 start_codon:yes stop_codon:yes gene_type:complete